jgi:site-specific DNA-methyltransferase (adenine-specific)
MNTLYLGDCLNVLRDNVPDESVDLVYIDPPFNSKRDYNIFFDDKEIQTQRIAFEDTWTLKNIQDSLAELHTLKTDYLYFLLLTYQKVAPHAFPYLTMMSLRILELHRVLKPTGSFYLHCDPTMSHYLKTSCDIIFGENNFRNEVSWKRADTHNDAKTKFPNITDYILFYSKSDKTKFYTQHTIHADKTLMEWYQYLEFPDGTVRKMTKDELVNQSIPYGTRRFNTADMTSPNPRPNLMYIYKGYPFPTKGWRYSKEKMKELDEQGKLLFPKNKDGRIMLKRYLDEQKGAVVGDNWSDISQLRANDQERLGYPTQKPKALLERIIQASSNEGDTVLDAFCGCGTTVDAAEGLHRNWIGVDISPIAISLIKRRLKDTYGEHLNKFEVRGTPTDEQSAIELWKQNPNAFQDWWLTEFEVFSTTFGTKGADKGIDGIAQYLVSPHSPPFAKGRKQKGGSTFASEEGVIRVAFQVKGGVHIQSKDIDALLGTMDKHKCELGVFLTIAEPTKPMLDTIASSGFIEIPGFKIPRLQILTLEDYFKKKLLKLPKYNITFKAAQLKGKKKQNQMKLDV